MIGVRGRLRRPSKRTYLVLAILFGTIVSAFAVGQSFKGIEDGDQLSVIGETALASQNSRVVSQDVAAASATAMASDSSKAAS